MAVDPNTFDGPATPLVSPSTSRQGMLAETIERSSFIGSSSTIVSQTIYFTSIELTAGTTVTNIGVSILVAGSAITGSKVGLYDKLGNRRALSADQGTNWHSTGNKVIAMITPYVIPVSDTYYIAWWATFTATTPKPATTATNATLGAIYGAAIGSGVLPFGTMVTQTDLVDPATIAIGAPCELWAFVT